jgi:REP element-mobilizing transposase RayT
MSYIQNTLHFIFSTQRRIPVLDTKVRGELLPYIAGIARGRNIRPITINGVADHLHLLLALPSTITLAQAMQAIKGGSSRWLNEKFPKSGKFAWQKKYGAFSVSHSRCAAVMDYIERQEEHHRKKTFKEEFREFLEVHGVDYDERYIWE